MNASLPDIGDLARRQWGEHNAHLSTKTELRFGANGSKSVKIIDRTWFDHEAGNGGGYADLHEVVLGVRPADASIASTYDYHDANGQLVYQVVRKVPKKFVQRRPDGSGGWEWNLHGITRVPYRLPDLLRAAADATVFIVEGEKDADALRDRMLVATTNAGGAGKWEASFATYFRNRRVVVIADNDEAGEAHARDVHAKLSGRCASISILRLPDLPPKGDVSDWLSAGGTAELLEELVAAGITEEAPRNAETSAASTPGIRRELAVLTPADCEHGNPRPYVVKGLIARADHVQVIGPPGSGKSALAPLAGYCIALGVPFLGRRVRQGTVLYVAAEDGHGMKLRVRALRRRLGDAPGFLLVPDAINLYDAESGDLEKVVRLIRDHQPVAVFIDTIARAFPGLKENDSDSMGRVVSVMRRLAAEECQPAIVTVHHVAKDAGSTPRGHGVLAGDLDAVLLIEGSGAEMRAVRMGKNRNGPSDATFCFNVGTVEFEPDEDGDPVGAPIAEPVEAPAANRKTEAEAKLSDAATLMLREIRTLMDGYATLLQPGDGHPSVLSVSRSLLRSRLMDRGWFADSQLSVETDGKKTLLRAGYTFESNALRALKRRNIISHNQTHLWLV